MPDLSIPEICPPINTSPEPTTAQRRAWACVESLLSDYAERLGADDLAKLMDMAWIEPADFSEQDIDDAMLAYETYVEDRA
jgi:hypothetical protein